MLRFLLLCIILLLPLETLASTYAVNIAVYKNIHTLKSRIHKLGPKLQKTIVIKHKKNLYRARTLPTENLKILKKLLPQYQAEFSDANIVKLSNDSSYFKER